MIENIHRLAAVGPIDPQHGYPMWLQDETGTRLELGLGPDPLLPAIGEVPNPGAPLQIPANFPDESFYFYAEARMPVGGAGVVGRARLILALEAAFGGAGAPDPRARVLFARIRVRMDDLVPGATYVVTHPYGVTEELTADDDGRVAYTNDRGIADQQFEPVLRDGLVAPFLRWSDGAPGGYLGDGVSERPITGSPFGTNIFRVDGARVAEAGGPRDPADPTNPDRVQTDLFTVQGKVATRLGVTLDRASYRRSANGLVLDVHASSVPDQQLELDEPRVHLSADGTVYSGRVEVPTLPDTVRVLNVSDVPVSVSTAQVVDLVQIQEATWDADTGELRVVADSSDTGAAALTVIGYGPLSGPTSFPAEAAPATVTVTSSAGGVAERLVEVSGTVSPALPPIAAAGADQSVTVGRTVTLDATGSRGAQTWVWQQTAGPAVVLSGNGPLATFTAATIGTLEFEVTVTGSAGTSTDSTVVTLVPAPPPDTLVIERSQFRTSRRQFRVGGTCTGPLPNRVTVSVKGTELAGSAVDITGSWSLVHTLTADQSGLAPVVGDVLSAVSDGGGAATAGIAIRN